jgi:hypothetical protein
MIFFSFYSMSMVSFSWLSKAFFDFPFSSLNYQIFKDIKKNFSFGLLDLLSEFLKFCVYYDKFCFSFLFFSINICFLFLFFDYFVLEVISLFCNNTEIFFTVLQFLGKFSDFLILKLDFCSECLFNLFLSNHLVFIQDLEFINFHFII